MSRPFSQRAHLRAVTASARTHSLISRDRPLEVRNDVKLGIQDSIQTRVTEANSPTRQEVEVQDVPTRQARENGPPKCLEEEGTTLSEELISDESFQERARNST